MGLEQYTPSQIRSMMTPAQRAAMDQDAASRMIAVTSDLYYSEVAFQPTITGGVATMAQAIRKPFGYKIGDDLSNPAIGYSQAPGTPADKRHTNLGTPSQTKDGQTILIKGVAIAPRSDSDADLLLKLAPHMVARCVFGGGSTVFDLGPLELVPGACGYQGVGSSVMREPEQNVATAKGIGAIGSGFPHGMNFRRFPKPFKWAQAGQADSTFSMEIELVAQQVFNLPAARAAAAGVSAYVVPATGQLSIKLLAWLDTVQVSQRSANR